MKIVVACRCGQHFATHRRHLGKTVSCPACGASLTIAAAPPVPPPPPAARGIRVACVCGWSFSAPLALEGQAVACPGCRGTVAVPFSDPLHLGQAASAQPRASSPWLAPAESSSIFSDKLAMRLAYLAGGSVALLALAIMVTSSFNNLGQQSHGSALADATTGHLTGAAASPHPAAPTETSLPPPPPADSAAETSQRADAITPESTSRATPESPSSADAAPGSIYQTPPQPASFSRPPSAPSSQASHARSGELNRLPEASLSWLEQSEARLTGVRRVGPQSPPSAHFSWLTSLLPYMDQQDVYERIDFSQPVTHRQNLVAGATIIPDFVNPHEDRHSWTGYPFAGLALTHYAGMSGVENTRNEVAAKLPRSDPRAGVFGYDEVARPSEITDGASQTIMIVGSGAMANPWIMGGGGTIRGAREPLFDPVTGLGTKGLPGGGTLAVMADGSVRHVSAKVEPRVFKAMSTIHGAESVDLDRSASPLAREDWKAAKRPADKASQAAGKRPITN